MNRTTGLTLLLSFIPRDPCLFDLSSDAQHHGHGQQIRHLDDEAFLPERDEDQQVKVTYNHIRAEMTQSCLLFFFPH